MKLIIQKADNFKEVNKIIEIESTNINDNDITYFIKANETPVIKYTDTNETFLINNIQESLKQYEGSEILLIVNEPDLISLGGSSFNIKGQFENNTEAINNGLLIGDIYSLPIIDDVSLLAVVAALPTYNFDLTSPNWTSEGVTDEASFINWLATRSYEDSNDLTNIVITDFNFVGDRIFCNMNADGTIYGLSNLGLTTANKIGVVNGLNNLYLGGNQIVTFNPTIPLPSSLTYLYLYGNQIVNFNTSIALPNNLEALDLSRNQIVNFNPTVALPSSLTYLSVTHNKIVNFNPTVALPSALTHLDLRYNQIINFNPTVALPSGLININLRYNQIINFNPTVALPSGLINLDLSNNKMTTSGYTASEVWANAQPSFINTCNIYFSENINSITGTTLKTLLLTKNVNIIA